MYNSWSEIVEGNNEGPSNNSYRPSIPGPDYGRNRYSGNNGGMDSYQGQRRSNMSSMENDRGIRPLLSNPSVDTSVPQIGSGSATGRLLKLMENPATASLLERALAEDSLAMSSGPRRPSRLLANMGVQGSGSGRMGDQSYSSQLPREESLSQGRNFDKYNDDYFDDDSSTSKVHCGFVSFTDEIMDRNELREIFEDFGPVGNVEIAANQKTAFISFQHATAAADSIEALHNSPLRPGGPQLKVSMAMGRPSRGSGRGRGSIRGDRDDFGRGRGRGRGDDRRDRGGRGSRGRGDRGSRGRGRGSRSGGYMGDRSFGEVDHEYKGRDSSSRRESYEAPRIERVGSKEPKIYVSFTGKVKDSKDLLTVNSIRGAFEQFGELTDVNVPKRGTFAFVSFASKACATRAIEACNNETIMEEGPVMKVEWTKEFAGEIDNKSTYESNKPSSRSAAKFNTSKPSMQERLQFKKVQISQEEEKDAIALNCPTEGLYCAVCDTASFANTKHYINHLRGHQHAFTRDIVSEKQRSLVSHLNTCAKLAERQKEVKMELRNSKESKVVKEENLSAPTPERASALRAKGKQKCITCDCEPYVNYLEYVDHMCSVLHLKTVYEAEKKKVDGEEVKEEGDKMERLCAEIESAKEMASMCPISLEEPPVYDAEESFGLENITKITNFRCLPCDRELYARAVKNHCRSVAHYDKSMEGIKRKMAEEMEQKSNMKRKRSDDNKEEGSSNADENDQIDDKDLNNFGEDNENLDLDFRSEASDSEEGKEDNNDLDEIEESMLNGDDANGFLGENNDDEEEATEDDGNSRKRMKMGEDETQMEDDGNEEANWDQEELEEDEEV